MIDAIAKKYGRVAVLTENPSVSSILREGEYQYFTTKGHCDCGTVLANEDADTPDRVAERSSVLTKQKLRLKRKGWSQAKISRWLDEKQGAQERRKNDPQDSFELWANLVAEIAGEADVKSVGILVHHYSGLLTEEIFEANRTEVRFSEFRDRLSSMKEDELLIAVSS